MYKVVLLIVVAGCGRPADEDCWRGPVPIVRECDCDATSPPLHPAGVRSEAYAPQGRRGRDAPPDPISLELTQLMIDPTDLPDRDGEWIEVHNPSPLPVDLRDVAVAVNGTARCVLSGTRIPAFGYLLLARAGTPNHRACPGLSLPNRRGEVALVRCGEVLDVMVWEKAPRGEAISASRPPRRSSPRPPS